MTLMSMTVFAVTQNAVAVPGGNQENGGQSNEGTRPTLEQQRQERVQHMKEKEAAERNAEKVKTQAERAQGNAVGAVEHPDQAVPGANENSACKRQFSRKIFSPLPTPTEVTEICKCVEKHTKSTNEADMMAAFRKHCNDQD